MFIIAYKAEIIGATGIVPNTISLKICNNNNESLRSVA